uniref:Uncharacterized protein n=1 Tax=Spermophilus dauricus TaxID=99837 RepID=A0A8C9P7X2_SPEDA
METRQVTRSPRVRLLLLLFLLVPWGTRTASGVALPPCFRPGEGWRGTYTQKQRHRLRGEGTGAGRETTVQYWSFELDRRKDRLQWAGAWPQVMGPSVCVRVRVRVRARGQH